jgi:hypothetical protein
VATGSPATASRRTRAVVEALGEADVLDADRVADAPDDALAVRGVGQAARQLPYVRAVGGLPLALGRQRAGLDAAQEFGDRRRGVDDLPGGHDRALRHRVALPELHGVQAERGGHLVHLRLVGEARLDGAEAAHGAAGRVVGVEGERLYLHVPDDVRADAEGGRVADDRRGGGGVGAAVEHDPGPDVGQSAVAGGAVLVVELGGVAVDVAEEGLEPVVDHLDRLAGAQCQQAGVDLHGQVLASAEGAADAGQGHPDPVLGQAEDGRDLAQVGVEPLGGDVQVDAAVLGGHGEPGLGAEEGLVLHAEGVVALDDHVGARPGRRHVAAHDRLAVDDVGVRDVAAVVVRTAGVQDRCVRGEGAGLVGDDREFAVLDLDPGRRPARGLGVVGGDERDGFAVVAHPAVGEDGGVPDLQPVVADVGGQVVVGHHRVHARGGERLAGVEGDDLGVGDRGAQDLPPQHVLVPQVGGVRELAGDLEGAVRAGCGLADAAGGVLGVGALGQVRGQAGGRHGGQAPSDWRAAARRTASMIFS